MNHVRFLQSVVAAKQPIDPGMDSYLYLAIVAAGLLVVLVQGKDDGR